MNVPAGSKRLVSVARSHEVAQIEEMCAAVARMPQPLSRVLRLTIAGDNPAHMAQVTGLSVHRIEQLLTAVAHCMEAQARASQSVLCDRGGNPGSPSGRNSIA